MVQKCVRVCLCLCLSNVGTHACDSRVLQVLWRALLEQLPAACHKKARTEVIKPTLRHLLPLACTFYPKVGLLINTIHIAESCRVANKPDS